MCLIVKNRKAHQSAKLIKGVYHYDKTDPKNLKLPLNIDNISEDNLNIIIQNIVIKYKKLNYKEFSREELDVHKEWEDLTLLILIKFYKNGWSIKIPDERKFFPSFTFTYNLIPLKKEIDKIVSFCHDHIDEKNTREQLHGARNFSGLDVTYLLHYFVIMHPDYKER